MTRLIMNGVYEVEAPAPCHIVDMTIEGATPEVERLKGILYHVVVDHQRTQQAPFGEFYLSERDGDILGDYRYGWDHPEIWHHNVRVAFLMHFLEPGRHITTPYGKVIVPEVRVRPKRLASIAYTSPY